MPGVDMEPGSMYNTHKMLVRLINELTGEAFIAGSRDIAVSGGAFGTTGGVEFSAWIVAGLLTPLIG
jgi:hypothetical protein